MNDDNDLPEPEPLRCDECGTLLNGFDCPACRAVTAARERHGKRNDIRRWRGARLERLAYKMHPSPRQAARIAQLWETIR